MAAKPNKRTCCRQCISRSDCTECQSNTTSDWLLTPNWFSHLRLCHFVNLEKKVTDWLFFLNSLPDNKILDWSQLKAFADGKLKELNIMIFVFDRVENIVGKGENAGNQHFFLFP